MFIVDRAKEERRETTFQNGFQFDLSAFCQKGDVIAWEQC